MTSQFLHIFINKRKCRHSTFRHESAGKLMGGGGGCDPPTFSKLIFKCAMQWRRCRRNGTASGKSPRNSPFISVFQVQEIKLQICSVRFLSSCWLSSFYLSFFRLSVISRLDAPFKFTVHSLHETDSNIPWAVNEQNGTRKRCINQFIDLLSHWLSLGLIWGTDFSEKQFLDVEFLFYIFVYMHLEDSSG